jgi:hypothetical protein
MKTPSTLLIPLITIVLITQLAAAARKSEPDVAAPTDLETCFSPDESCDLKLVKFIRSAQTSIDVAIFDLTLDQVAHELLVASKRIPVRIVADLRQANSAHSLIPMMIKAGAKIRIGRQRGIMHN